MTDDTIGIDVSKATLDVHWLSDGKMTSFSNDTAGFKQLAKFCNETTVIRVVYEATGAYHKGLERALGFGEGEPFAGTPLCTSTRRTR